METTTNGKQHKNGKRQTIGERLHIICMRHKRQLWTVAFLMSEFVGKRMSKHYPKAALKTIRRQVVNNFGHVKKTIEEEGHGLVLPLGRQGVRMSDDKRGWYLARPGDEGIAKEILSRKGRTVAHGNALIRGLRLAIELKLLPPAELKSLTSGIDGLRSLEPALTLPALPEARP